MITNQCSHLYKQCTRSLSLHFQSIWNSHLSQRTGHAEWEGSGWRNRLRPGFKPTKQANAADMNEGDSSGDYSPNFDSLSQPGSGNTSTDICSGEDHSIYVISLSIKH